MMVRPESKQGCLALALALALAGGLVGLLFSSPSVSLFPSLEA